MEGWSGESKRWTETLISCSRCKGKEEGEGLTYGERPWIKPSASQPMRRRRPRMGFPARYARLSTEIHWTDEEEEEEEEEVTTATAGRRSTLLPAGPRRKRREREREKRREEKRREKRRERERREREERRERREREKREREEREKREEREERERAAGKQASNLSIPRDAAIGWWGTLRRHWAPLLSSLLMDV